MQIRIGDTYLYDCKTVAEGFDGHKLSEFDGIRLEDLFISNRKWYSVEPLTIEHYIDGRATCNFRIKDLDGEFDLYERERLLVLDADLNPLNGFAGVVQKVENYHIPGWPVAKDIVISAADYTAVLGWRQVSYAAEDKLAGDAVREIMEEYLAAEGITEGYIEGGELLTEISISNKSVLEAYEKLAEACGFVAYISYDYKLYFHRRTLYAAEWSITDESDIMSETLEITRSNENYRNTEIVIGGYEETSLQTEPIATDGISKSYALGYPVNRVASATFTPDGGDPVALTIGVKGYDTGEDYDIFFANKSETVTFNEVPVVGICEIEYYGLWRAMSIAEDLTAIDDNADRQGFGSGKVEHVTIDESLTSIVAAGEYANAKLAEYARDGIQVSYKTRREGLAAGTLQHIEVQGLNHDFLITCVEETYQEGDVEYVITACYGPVTDEWDKFLNQSFSAIYQIREGLEGTNVTKLYNFSHIYEEIDRPNPFTVALPGTLVSDDTWPCFKPEDRTFYIEFWASGAPFFRKLHTLTPDITDNEIFHSYSFISPGEGNGEVEEIVWFGGDSCTSEYGTGVEIYRADLNKTKNILLSYQINMTYINGA